MDRFVAYLASAGSGKTFTLAVRYISLLFLGEHPNSILVATFTKKATKEMKERIILFLNTIVKSPKGDKSKEEIITALMRESKLSKEEIKSRANRVYSRFLLSQNYIVTLDSFFNLILRATSLLIGVDSNYSVYSNAHTKLEENFLRDLKYGNLIRYLVNISFIAEKRKSEDILKSLLTIYKEEPILPKREYQLQDLKTIEDRALDLNREIKMLLEDFKASKRTINNFCVKSINEIIEKGYWKKETLCEHSWYKKYCKESSELDRLFFELKDTIREYFLAMEENILYYINELYERYKVIRLDEIRANSEVDFDDIKLLVHKITSNIEKEFIYFKLDSKFKHILIDEFQDTSAIQYLIIEPLINEIFSGEGLNSFRTFFYVGDTKQSLYRFRGGVEELFQYLANRYNIEVLTLNKNYRSQRNIVNFVNRTFEKLMDNYTTQEAQSDKDGYVEVLTQANTNEDVLENILDRVNFLIEQGSRLEDIAILIFINKDAILIQEFLKINGIETTLKTKNSIKSSPKIASLVNILRYLVSKDRNRVLIEPFLKMVRRDNIELKFKTELPFDILDELILKYSYFQNDMDILKLLEFAKEFTTIEKFLEEFDRADINLGDRDKGISLITIHNSKGLEFKSVIIVDRMGGKSNMKDMITFKSKTPIEVEKIIYRRTKRDIFDSEYQEFLEVEKSLEKKDLINSLYVATTRAKEALFIIPKAKNSQFELLNLTPQVIGELNFIYKEDRVEDLKELPNRLSYYGKEERGDIDSKKNKTEIEEEKNLDAIFFGKALHYGAELCNFESRSCQFAKSGVVNQYGQILKESEIEDIYNRLELLMGSEEFFRLIDGAKILKEQPITYRNSLFQIDLLASFPDKNIVIDYKSSKNYQYKERYEEQVRGYVEALTAIDNKETIGYIAYLLKNGVRLERV